MKKETVHKVLIHQEHNPQVQKFVQLCEYHYRMAVSCRMVDEDHGTGRSSCTFCKFSEVDEQQ